MNKFKKKKLFPWAGFEPRSSWSLQQAPSDVVLLMTIKRWIFFIILKKKKENVRHE
jgi:hypothetical protein